MISQSAFYVTPETMQNIKTHAICLTRNSRFRRFRQLRSELTRVFYNVPEDAIDVALSEVPLPPERDDQ